MPLNATRTEQGIVVLNSFWQQSHFLKKKKKRKKERKRKRERKKVTDGFFLSPVINDFFFLCRLQSKRFVCHTAKWGSDVTVSGGACMDAFRWQENELRGLFLCAAVHVCCNTPTALGTRFWCSTTNLNISVCSVTRQITRPVSHSCCHCSYWTAIASSKNPLCFTNLYDGRFFFSFFPPWDWIVVYRFRNATSACSIRLWHIKQQSLYYKEHAVNVSGV